MASQKIKWRTCEWCLLRLPLGVFRAACNDHCNFCDAQRTIVQRRRATMRLGVELAPAFVCLNGSLVRPLNLKMWCSYCDSYGPCLRNYVIPFARGGRWSVPACPRCVADKGERGFGAWFWLLWAANDDRVPAAEAFHAMTLAQIEMDESRREERPPIRIKIPRN